MHTKSLSDYLQQKDLEFVSATDMITSLQEVLQNMRSESSYDEYFIKAEAKCTELEIDEPLLPPKVDEYLPELMKHLETNFITNQQKTIIEWSFTLVHLI